MRSKLLLLAAILTGLSGCGLSGQPQAQQPDSPPPFLNPPPGQGNPPPPGQGGPPPEMRRDMQVSSEQDYLMKMISHHQEAIDAAKLVLERSDRSDLKQFAQEIIQSQTAEVNQMQQWLREWYSGQQASTTPQPMLDNLKQAQGDAIDQAFLKGMMIHHMGGVMMSQTLIQKNLVQHDAVRPFAEKVASSQQQEIQQMQKLLKN